jgi:hypothetical protein
MVSLVAFCAASFLLVTASPVLILPAIESFEMPWGTLITWIGMLSLPSLVYFVFPGLMDPKTRFQRILKWLWMLSLIFAVFWPFFSFFLAGNWSYNFRGQEEFRGSSRASAYFWDLTKGTAIFPLLVFLGILLERFISRSKEK